VVGDALTWDNEVVGLKLFDEGLVDAALCAVGESRLFVGDEGH
jgi:hypothetical protein